MDWLLYNNGLRHERVKTERASEVVLLEIVIDDQLTFKTHIYTLGAGIGSRWHLDVQPF